MWKKVSSAILACWVSTAIPTAGAEWPIRTVRIIVPSPAGASNDTAARLMAEQLSKMWQQPVIIENRPGAGGTIASNIVAKAAPDGYTIGWVISAHAINPSLYANLPYDAVGDFAGVTMTYTLKAAIVAAPGFAANTSAELIELATRNPGKLTFASPGTGSSVHLLGELFKLQHALDVPHVPYKGASAAYADVMAGRVSYMFDALPNVLPLVQSGKLKLLAIISDRPVPSHPEVPIVAGLLPAEANVGWNGIFAPARTPPQIIAKLNADIISVIRSPEMQQRFRDLEVQTVTSTPKEFDAFIKQDVVRWAAVVRRAGIKLEQGN